MQSYWTWFDVDVATGLNAHVRYLANELEENACLYLSYLSKPVEIPVYKRCFKTKPTAISLLIRTTEVGRSELKRVSSLLDSAGFSLRFRHSPKKRFLNQVTVPLPIDDPSYPLKARSVLTTVARVLGEDMPDRIIIGHHKAKFGEPLPGKIHFDRKAATIGYKLGKNLGTIVRRD